MEAPVGDQGMGESQISHLRLVVSLISKSLLLSRWLLLLDFLPNSNNHPLATCLLLLFWWYLPYFIAWSFMIPLHPYIFVNSSFENKSSSNILLGYAICLLLEPWPIKNVREVAGTDPIKPLGHREEFDWYMEGEATGRYWAEERTVLRGKDKNGVTRILY